MTLGGCVYLGNENEKIFHSIITTLLTLRLPVEYNASFNVNRVFCVHLRMQWSIVLWVLPSSSYSSLCFRFCVCISLYPANSIKFYVVCFVFLSFLCCLPVFFRIVIPFAKLLKFCPHSFARFFFFYISQPRFPTWFGFRSIKGLFRTTSPPNNNFCLRERQQTLLFYFCFQILVKVCPL